MTIAIAAAYGLLFGSFLTVVVDRVPRGASIVSPGSACGNCGLRLGFLDLIPVVSWLALRGKCRRCRMDIGKEPLILELVTGLLFGLFAWKFGLDWALPAYCVLAVGLVGLSWIDLKTKRLPRQIIYITAAVGIPLLCIAALARLATPVLAVSVDDDQFTPFPTVDHLCAKLTAAPVERVHFSADEAGAPLDHFLWVRASAPLATRIADFVSRLPDAERRP